MKALVRRSDHCIALGIERDDGVRIPVSGVPSPTSWGACPGVRVELMVSLQDGVVLTGISGCRANVADATVPVIVVVPADKPARPLAGLLKVCDALRRELRPVLRRAEQHLDQGSIVADIRAGLGNAQPQPVHHRQDSGGLKRRAVVPVQDRRVIQCVQILAEGCAAQQIHGVFGVVGLVDIKPDHLAADQIQDRVQKEPGSGQRVRQVRHVPTKDLPRSGGDMRARRTGPSGQRANTFITKATYTKPIHVAT